MAVESVNPIALAVSWEPDGSAVEILAADGDGRVRIRAEDMPLLVATLANPPTSAGPETVCLDPAS